MARCAGCSGGGTVNHTNTTCLTMTGDGSADDPLIGTVVIDPSTNTCLNCGPSGLRLVIDPDGGNALSCGPAGLLASGGGGGGQKIYFTVGTPGIAALGGSGATESSLLSTADFVGDGVNDSVAIQAGINAIQALFATLSNVVLFILPGFYAANTTLDTKGVVVRGENRAMTLLYHSSAIGAPANTRVINSAQAINIEDLQLFSQTGGAAALRTPWLHMVNCDIIVDSKGADVACIDVGQILTANASYGQFLYNTVQSGGTDPVLAIRDNFGLNMLIQGNFFQGDVIFSGSNVNSVIFEDNTINGNTGNLFFTGTNMTRFWIERNIIISGSIIATLAGGSSFEWFIRENNIFNGNIDIDSLIVSQIKDNYISAIIFGIGMDLSNFGDSMIQGNYIDGAQSHGMLLTSAHNSMVQGNRIRSYGNAGGNLDGIQIVTSDECVVQDNKLVSGTARYGINVVSGNNNFVTNNMLRGSGLTASFNNTATATVTAAGNNL